MITEKQFTRAGLVALSLGFAALAYRQGGARANGIPTMNPLTYAGTIEEPGAPPTGVTGSRNLRVVLWDHPTSTDPSNRRCATPGPDTTVATAVTNGRFQIPLAGNCVTAVQETRDLWLEVVVGTTSLPRTKLSAVPYAVESQHAVSADTATGALAGQVVPAGMIGMFTGACPTGWTLCDGSSGTPDLRGAYPKGGTGLAARAGSNTHQHGAGTLAAASGGGMTAGVSIASDGGHSHLTMIDSDASGLYGRIGPGGISWPANHRFATALSGAGGFSGFTGTNGLLTDTTGVHTHPGSTVSIPAHGHSMTGVSAMESNEPVNVTLAFCMKQ